MMVDVSFGVQRVHSMMLIGVSFEEQIFERVHTFFLEGNHHLVAQAKGDQLEENIEKQIGKRC